MAKQLCSCVLLVLLVTNLAFSTSGQQPNPAPRIGPVPGPIPNPTLPPRVAPGKAPAPAPSVPPTPPPLPPPPPAQIPTPTHPKKSRELTGGQKAGVAFGVIAGAGLLGLAGFVYKKRQNNIRRAKYGSRPRTVELGERRP